MTQQRQHEEIRAALEDIAAAIREDKEPSSDVFTKDEYGYVARRFLHLMDLQGHRGEHYTLHGRTFNTESLRERLSRVSGLPIHDR